MNRISKDRIVYHGTQEPPGTPLKGIRQPSFRNPFFVGDTPEIALTYIPDSGSVYVILLSDSPKKLAFDLSSISGARKLSSKMPKTSKALVEYLSKYGSSADGSSPKFFGLVHSMIEISNFVIENGRLPVAGKDDVAKYDDENNIVLIADSLKELGLLNSSGTDIVDEEFKKYVKAGIAADKDLFGASSMDMRKARRIIREKFNKAAYDLGYMMVGDKDTSADTDDMEYAILDKSVCLGGTAVSVIEEDIERAKRALLKNSDFKPTKIPEDVNASVTEILSKKKNGRFEDNTIPNSWRSKLTKLVIPSNITYIDMFPLRGCKNLTSVVIPDSVVEIHGSPLTGAWGKVNSVVLGNGLKDNEANSLFDLQGIDPNATITVPKDFDKNFLKKILVPVIYPDGENERANNAENTIKIRVV